MGTEDVKTYTEKLHSELKARIETVEKQSEDHLIALSICFKAVNEAICNLKRFIHRYKFSSEEEEIEFFKKLKPGIVSKYYYYEKVIHLKVNEPISNNESVKSYYEKALIEVQDIIRTNLEFYTYYLSGATDLDRGYFLRTNSKFRSPQIDSDFTTEFDDVLSRIVASQFVRDHLIGIVENNDSKNDGGVLTWTTKKAYLVELIYALHASHSFNSGKAEIKQIARLFERLFSVNLGNFYRHFQDIALRKNNRTTFLDELKAKFEERLDQSS